MGGGGRQGGVRRVRREVCGSRYHRSPWQGNVQKAPFGMFPSNISNDTHCTILYMYVLC